MFFRVAGREDAEVVIFADEFYEVARVREVFRPLAYDVAAHRKDVVYPLFAQRVERRAHFVARRADAGEVRERGNRVVALDARGYLRRVLAARAASAVCDADKVGVEASERVYRVENLRKVALALGRENFK